MTEQDHLAVVDRLREIQLEISKRKEEWITQCLIVHGLKDADLKEFELEEWRFEDLGLLSNEILKYRGLSIGKWKVYLEDGNIQIEGMVLPNAR